MPKCFCERILPYSCEEMFNLVADIEKYPQFLPWCQSLTIDKHSGNEVIATIEIGTGKFMKSFTSKVMFNRPERILISHCKGQLKHLRGEWIFRQHHSGCFLSFYLDFSLRSRFLDRIINLAFSKIFAEIESAFMKRAEQLYSVRKK